MTRKKTSQTPNDVVAAERKNLPAEARMLIADAKNDITIPFFTDVLQPVDDTLISRGGGKGLKIYDEIERDTHAWAVLQKRKKTLLAREWEIKAGGDRPADQDAADFVRDVVETLSFDRLCEDLLDATLKGFSIAEIVWRRDGDRIIPARIVAHDQRRFTFDVDWRPRLLTWKDTMRGEELPERKFIVHRHGVKGNNPFGLGLGTRLFWPVLFKREGVAFWLHFLDKFAAPTVVGKSPYGTLESNQRELLQTLSSLVTKSAIAVPIGTDVEFLEAARSGAVSYKEWCEYWDRQMSICVLGETLTTDIGNSGSRAASETHREILELLVDADADLLSDTLREQLITWLVEYNRPGAAVPNVWRVRPSSEKAKAETRKATAEAATAEDSAIVQIVATAGQIDDDDDARAYITSFGVTAQLSDETIDRLVDARFAFMDGGKRGRDIRMLGLDLGGRKKKVLTPPSPIEALFAEPDAAGDLAGQAEAHAARLIERRIADIVGCVEVASSLDEMAGLILGLGAAWKPAGLAGLLGEALELAALQGREAVFREVDGEDDADAFAEPDVFNQPFKEQIAFFRQKRGKPTRAWTDALRGVHDRAFVIAGATDRAMLADFQEAIAQAMEKGTTLDDFRKDFDRIVARYGWSYKGERGWRTRVIFETNIRTAYMAGRLKQMRDPDVIRMRPFWEYRHGETRKPKVPRPLHRSWHGRIHRHDDPWWKKHFPPNDYLCSCGVRTLSKRDLERRGKSAPDTAPEDLMEAIVDPVTGKLVEHPQGIGYGWDYMPGDLWSRGLVPSAFDLDEPLTAAVALDVAEPIDELVAAARPFKAKDMKDGLPDEDYISAFLGSFDAAIGKPALFTDVAGEAVAVSEEMFQQPDGKLKIGKRTRAVQVLRIAETIRDPDEIWIGASIRTRRDTGEPVEEMMMYRRYIRVDPVTALIAIFDIADKGWTALTAFAAERRGKPAWGYLHNQRVGKRVYRRGKK